MFRALFVLALAILAGCAEKAPTPPIPSYTGPEVTQLFVSKERRQLYLLHGTEVIKAYPISLGFTPQGHKQAEGDGRTPEGIYWINRRNPQSQYHLSLGISYPNTQDTARARAAGVSPGGDIFIHGEGKLRAFLPDWTAGCIAVSNHDIEEIYAMVPNGTPIVIKP